VAGTVDVAVVVVIPTNVATAVVRVEVVVLITFVPGLRARLASAHIPDAEPVAGKVVGEETPDVAY
jgi:hypothetical protein